MKLVDIQYVLEDWSPISNAEDFDNVGLLVGDPSAIIEKALITLDTTQNIVDEAIDQNCNLIITFHPFLYKGTKCLMKKTQKQFSMSVISRLFTTILYSF